MDGNEHLERTIKYTRLVEELYAIPRSLANYASIRLLDFKVCHYSIHCAPVPPDLELKHLEVEGWLVGMVANHIMAPTPPNSPTEQQKFISKYRGYATATPPRKQIMRAPPVRDTAATEQFLTFNTMQHNERIDELLAIPLIKNNLSRLWCLLEVINADRFPRKGRLREDMLRDGDVWRLAEVSGWVRAQFGEHGVSFGERRLLQEAANRRTISATLQNSVTRLFGKPNSQDVDTLADDFGKM